MSMPVKVYAAHAKKIIIDAGHGGIGYGCTIKNLHEKDITLDISREVQSCLKKVGYDVVLTRNSDVSLYKYCKTGDTIQKRDLNARVNMINNSNASVFVSIHVNSYLRNPGVNGSIVFYFSDEYLKSKSLAQSIQKSLNNLNYNGNKRTANSSRAENYYILRKTAMPGVLVETGFLTNPGERKWFATKEYRQKLAGSIALGVERYMASID